MVSRVARMWLRWQGNGFQGSKGVVKVARKLVRRPTHLSLSEGCFRFCEMMTTSYFK